MQRLKMGVDKFGKFMRWFAKNNDKSWIQKTLIIGLSAGTTALIVISLTIQGPKGPFVVFDTDGVMFFNFWNKPYLNGEKFKEAIFDCRLPFPVLTKDNKWKYFDGNKLLNGEYETAYCFSDDGFARVKLKNNTWQIINEKGNVVKEFEPNQVPATGLNNDRILIKNCGTRYATGAISWNDQRIVTMPFEGCDGGAFYDSKNNIIFKIKDQDLSKYNESTYWEGYSVVKTDSWFFNSYEILDLKGEIVGNINARDVGRISNGRARFLDVHDDFGFLDNKGNVVIQPIYKGATDFSDGLAAVKRNKYWSYIDVNGKEVIPGPFTKAYEFHNGVALVRIGESIYYYINTKGEVVFFSGNMGD